MKWIDLFTFLNKQANTLNSFGKFDWQKDIMIYDHDKYGALYSTELVEIFSSGKKEVYLKINSGDN
jgi:hypothetical protein